MSVEPRDVVEAMKVTIATMAEEHAMREAELIGQIRVLQSRIQELEEGDS